MKQKKNNIVIPPVQIKSLDELLAFEEMAKVLLDHLKNDPKQDEQLRKFRPNFNKKPLS